MQRLPKKPPLPPLSKQRSKYLVWVVLGATCLAAALLALLHWLGPEHLALVRRVGAALDPATYAAIPQAFEPGYASPCWRRDGKSLQCLPALYVLGSFHAGSHGLADKLQRFPHILTSVSSNWQFWAEGDKNIDGYLRGFEPLFAKIDNACKHCIIMDNSASTIAFYWAANLRAHEAFQKSMVPCARRCAEGSPGDDKKRLACMDAQCYPAAQAADKAVAQRLGVNYSTLQLPLVMRGVYGQQPPKLVMLLRHPIHRIWSAFQNYAHYKGRYGTGPNGFTKYIKEQVGEFYACRERGYSDAECALYFETLGSREEQVFFHCDQLMRGMYSIFLEHWLAHFPRANIFVVKSEEYFADPKQTMRAIAAWLGWNASVMTEQAWAQVDAAGAPRSNIAGAGPIPGEAAQLLRAFYAPHNKRLAQLLKDDYFLSWNK